MKKLIKLISLILVFCLALGASPVAFAAEREVPEMIEYGFVDAGDAKIEYGIYGKPDLC